MTRYTDMVRARIDLGHRIRALRRELRWSQEKLGKRAGLPRHTILDCELGARRVEALELRAIALALNTSMEALLGVPEEAGMPAWLRDLVSQLSPADLELMGTFGEFLLWRSRQPASTDG
jgi:transcriptional regulator with XRE-family HTH domain